MKPQAGEETISIVRGITPLSNSCECLSWWLWGGGKEKQTAFLEKCGESGNKFVGRQ